MPRRSNALAIGCALLAAGTFLDRLFLIPIRAFDPDELQHLHAAWLFDQGLLPFRDFFEHHMPGIYFLLLPVLRTQNIARDFQAVVTTILVSRSLMWCGAAAIVGFTILLGRVYRESAVGWIAGAFLSLSVVFVARTLEIRPDVPALMCWTACQWTLLSGVSARRAPQGIRWWIAAGLLFGGTLVFTQKALLAGPGLAIFAFVYLLAREKERSRTSRAAQLAAFAVSSLVPLAGVVTEYAAHGAVRSLIADGLQTNLHWIRETTARSTLTWMLLRDPLFSAFAVAGWTSAAFALRNERRRAVQAALWLPASSLFAGLGVIPAPFPQYLLLVLPAAAVYAAAALWEAALAAPEWRTWSRRAAPAAAALAFVIVAAFGLWISRPFFRNVTVYPTFGVGVAVVATWLARRGSPERACLVILLGVATLTAQQCVWMAGLSNRNALDEMRFIYAETKPTDTVMDGFSGVGWFRPHAAFYWFTNPGVRARMSTAEKQALVTMLRTCRQQPAAVILDDHLRGVSPQMESTVRTFYHPTQYPSVYLRGPRCIGNGDKVPTNEK